MNQQWKARTLNCKNWPIGELNAFFAYTLDMGNAANFNGLVRRAQLTHLIYQSSFAAIANVILSTKMLVTFFQLMINEVN